MTFQDRLTVALDLDLPPELLPLTITNQVAFGGDSDDDSIWH